MKFSAIFAGLSLSLITASAFHIPEGTPDGVYSVRTYPNGTEVHTRLSGPAPVTRRNAHQKRITIDSTACYPSEGTEELDNASTDAANAALQAQCGDGAEIDGYDDIYSISACVVAYACNFSAPDEAPYAPYPVFCYRSDSIAANQAITQACGAYKPGSVLDGPNDYLISYGYESYCTAKGHNFCGRGA
ncbi:hypothetical protein M409DRAFT_30153 [Zasmidium cellare ATCC 36951]|uniref:Ecp2 effector protein domain-containing protein n=1 Tax=Zasmidium cellare ATCC 36951 TaxID=1080233 RepID=A0A6A6BXS5_ZASCE|nr:uncharacterized protein M409DRAFT_30153 [Zasmidium cellare ATCC 36951]KAF2159403.1 hypothetical protein M409DRAFT_30153 [Zasmidium cellare ATCC 36951]